MQRDILAGVVRVDEESYAEVRVADAPYDPFDDFNRFHALGVVRDPYPRLAELRRACPDARRRAASTDQSNVVALRL